MHQIALLDLAGDTYGYSPRFSEIRHRHFRRQGGPPRHLHHDVDELFFSLEGEYIVEVGSDRFQLKPGDCVLGPREIPHAWAFAGGLSGRLLISFAPAGRMEAFFNERENRGIKPGAYTTAEFMRAFGMELLGPPLRVE